MRKGLVVFGVIIISMVLCQASYGQGWKELLDEADSLFAEYNYDSAIIIGKLALGEIEVEPNAEDSSIANVLYRLGLYNYYKLNYIIVDSLWKRSVAKMEKVFGREHQRVAKILNNLAAICVDQGLYAEGVSISKRAIGICERSDDPDNPLYHKYLITLATLYTEMENYLDAESIFKKLLSLKEKAHGHLHPEVENPLKGLGILSFKQGKYIDSERFFKRALAISRKADNPERSTLAGNLNNLAVVYRIRGLYAEAEPLYVEALAITEKILGPNHRDVSLGLNNLGLLYMYQAKYAAAESLLKRSYEIKIQTLGGNHPDVAIGLISLADFYLMQDKVDTAEIMYIRALEISKQVFGQEHTEVAKCLLGLAKVHRIQGKYFRAESDIERALYLYLKLQGDEHTNVAMARRVLGGIYQDQKRLLEAEQQLQLSIGIFEKALGCNHMYVAEYMESLSNICRLQDRNTEALKNARRAFEIREGNHARNALVLSERDAIAYTIFFRESTYNFLTCYFEKDSEHAKIVNEAANIIISCKGQVSDGIYERQRITVKETDSTTLALAEKLRLNKYLLSNLFVQGPGENVEEYRRKADSLDMLVNDLESNLSRHSASYRNYQDQKDISIDRIVSLLPGGSVLVEYLKYDFYQLKPDSTIPKYLAVLMADDGKPVIVDLGDASEIDPLIENYRDHMLKVSDRIPGPNDTDLKEYREISTKIYDKIWKPIEEYVGNQELIFIAPDGALNLVSFAGLINDDGKYLIEDQTIHYLSAGRDLIRLSDEGNPGSGLFAIGDPNFDSTATMSTRQASAPDDTDSDIGYLANITRNHRSGCAAFDELDLPRLVGTRSEVQAIMASWQQSTDEPAVAYFDDDATEDRFKEEAPGQRAIHLATHGFYYEGVCRPDLPQRRIDSDVGYVGENPLLLSGLFFAGANRNRDSLVNNSGEDGILTAYEVSAMNLEGTELVVLSACETGLGEVKDGEGVYGLRRAFQMAGARTVISALWRVSDQATSELLGKLYDEQGPSMPDRFRNMQLDKLRKLRDQNMVDHPISWAGFIALGDWR